MASIKRAMVSSLVLWACAGPGTDGTNGGEQVNAQSSGLDQGCANTTVLAKTGSITIDYLSPITYTQPDCYKGQVVELFIFPSPAPLPNGAVVDWASAVPDTEAACTSAWLGGYWFESNNGVGGGTSTYTTRDVQAKTGTWSGGVCTPPHIAFPFGLQPGAATKFRFALSARTGPTTGSPTRRFKIATQ